MLSQPLLPPAVVLLVTGAGILPSHKCCVALDTLADTSFAITLDLSHKHDAVTKSLNETVINVMEGVLRIWKTSGRGPRRYSCLWKRPSQPKWRILTNLMSLSPMGYVYLFLYLYALFDDL